MKTNEKIAQMKAQKQAIISKSNQRQRKKRTRRLIQNGALAEKYFDCKDIEPKDLEQFLKDLCTAHGFDAVLQPLEKKVNEEEKI